MRLKQAMVVEAREYEERIAIVIGDVGRTGGESWSTNRGRGKPVLGK